MNNFVGNLINRHQNGESLQASGFMVAPRPASRFENRTDPTTSVEYEQSRPSGLAYPPQSDPEKNHRSWQFDLNQRLQGFTSQFAHGSSDETNPIKNLENHDVRLSRESAGYHVSEEQSGAWGLSNTPDSPQSTPDELVARLQQLISRFSPESATVGIKNNEPEIRGIKGKDELSEPPRMQGQSASHVLFNPDNLIRRTQSIVKRLNGLQAKQTSDQHASAAQSTHSIPGPTEPTVSDLAGSYAPSIESTGDALADQHPTMDNAQTPSTQYEARQPAALQPPAWLADVQAGINKRLQDFSAHSSAAEPVVNVTIGRVEVRAVQPETQKQPARKKKPTGVMSLDDYLKARA